MVTASAVAVALWLAACTSTIASYAGASTSPPNRPALLPRKVVLSLSAVRRYFPEVTVVARSGDNETATGNPSATRSVMFTSADGTKKVTISVDRYAGSAGARSAFQEAVAKSEAVTGFKPLQVPNLGDKTFAGTVTQGSETHVGLGVLAGDLSIGATLAGFSADSENVGNLVSLAREEVANATSVIGNGAVP
ncbi:MAG TPA: hypothetical protein VK760_00255 [Candidatus Acidoferrales bacterium]|nr:hypothetical protein [Candidatus Acidoferrales bacterium]